MENMGGHSTSNSRLNVTSHNSIRVNSNRMFDDCIPQRIWIPQCKDEFKPYINQVFQSILDATTFYTEYGRNSGFDVCKTTGKTVPDGFVTLKYIVCNRAGVAHAKFLSNNEMEIQGTKRRMTLSRRCNFKAKITIKFFGLEGYKITAFDEEHNHELVPETARQFLKCNRNMTFAHKNFMYDCNKASLGPSKAHSVMKEIVGDYANIGATCIEYRNFQRDIKSYIGKKDVDMIIDKFSNNRENSDDGFYYEYKVDAEGHLSGLFWVDPIGCKNYEVYNDVVSVDATYDTNCYSMVFVLFTGVDKHWRSVTFAAGLISKEDLIYYKWIFDAFYKVMCRAPGCIITDQDPSMAVTIPQSLPGSTHRLCMWHIMKKFQLKVGPAICSKTNFLDRMNSIIWSEFISESDFEEAWNTIILDFGLEENKWLHDMFQMRSTWIPTFFKDKFMVGLLRSTSRSESINNYFSFFLKPGDTLVEFYMHYESALQKQMHTHIKLTNASSFMPKLLTPKLIEKDAANIYTHDIFLRVQEEITKSCYNVGIIDITTTDNAKVYNITDGYYKDKVFEVVVTPPSYYASCSCNMYIRYGYICSHSFVALYSCGVEKIPPDMICNRWVKNAEDRYASLYLGEILVRDDKSDRIRRKVSSIWFNFQIVLSAAGMNREAVDDLDVKVKKLMPSSTTTNAKKGVRLNDEIIEQLVGSKSHGDVVIQPPLKSRNKGCGKRILSPAEHNAKQREKPSRKCKNCGTVGSHDSRNCPEPPTTATKK